jgi:hypothetical protein
MIDSLGKRPRQHPIKCWGCEGDHMYKDCPHKGDRMRTMHNIQEDDTMDDVGRSMPRIYAALDNRQVDYQSHMIEVEGKIDNQPIAILIDSGASHNYIDPKIVERFKLKRCKHEKSWLVQLATGTKRKINELVKDFPVSMNGVGTKEDLNIIPLGSYDFLIGMDWLDKHHVILDCYNKAFTCLDEEGKFKDGARYSKTYPFLFCSPTQTRYLTSQLDRNSLSDSLSLGKPCGFLSLHARSP